MRDVENQLASIESHDDAVPAAILVDTMGPRQKELVEAAASPGETLEEELAVVAGPSVRSYRIAGLERVGCYLLEPNNRATVLHGQAKARMITDRFPLRHSINNKILSSRK